MDAQETYAVSNSYEAPNRYERPVIVYEGDLEIQAGSPLGLPDMELNDLDW